MPRHKSFMVEVNPTLLKWAIDSAGWEDDDLIPKLKIREEKYAGWLSGSINPTLRQLENLANKTKRPLATFLLPKPPKEKPIPKDYRMLPERVGKFDRKTILAIRKARALQSITKELSGNINSGTKLRLKGAKLSDDAKLLAKEYRKLFKVTEEKQTKEFKNAYNLYNHLRDKLEDYNVFSFQISMPVEDARGFALADESPAIIVVNSADLIEPRVFTLLHEFAHILLRETGISIPNFENTNRIERWCNQFAASFLLPDELARRIFAENRLELKETRTLNRFSRKYKVSKGMLLYSMFQFDFISLSEYHAVLGRYPPKPKEKTKTKKKSGGIPADRRCLSEVGNKFVSLVAHNVDKNHITYSDALSYLSIKSRNLNKVLSRAKK